MKQHLLLMCGLASRQQQQLSALRSTVSRVSLNYSGTFLWRINDVATKIAEARIKEGFELISAPFYTSQYGYKLQVRPFLNLSSGSPPPVQCPFSFFFFFQLLKLTDFFLDFLFNSGIAVFERKRIGRRCLRLDLHQNLARRIRRPPQVAFLSHRFLHALRPGCQSRQGAWSLSLPLSRFSFLYPILQPFSLKNKKKKISFHFIDGDWDVRSSTLSLYNDGMKNNNNKNMKSILLLHY